MSDTNRPAPPRIPLARYIGLGGGVALEWYDWSIYGLMAAFMGPHFFPSSDPVTSTLSALAVFALGFLVRPIAGAVLGPIADRVGHKRILLYSIGAMALCSLAIGIMPGYSTLGSMAGVLVLVARLVQGISTGIEQPAANAAALEVARPGKTGLFSGIVNGSFNQGGNLLASLVAFICSLAISGSGMAEWGWRLPFLIGAAMGVIVLFMRMSLPETGAAAAGASKAESVGQVWVEIWRHRLGVLAIIFVVAGTQIANYVWITGLPNLANSVYKENSSAVFGITTALMALLVISGPVVGWLADRFGSARTYLVIRIIEVPTYFALLIYVERNIGVFAAVMLGAGAVVALNQTLFNYITATLMPQHIRTTGVAIGYGIAVAVFGGTASYLFIDAQQANAMPLFVLYGAVVCALSVVIYLWAARRGHVIAKDLGDHEVDGASGVTARSLDEAI